MMKLKVCGMTCIDDMIACSNYNVSSIATDYMGFICYSGSKRFIRAELIAELYRALENFTKDTQNTHSQKITLAKGVLVMVNPTTEEIAELMNEEIIRENIGAIQFHGQESGEFCESISQTYNIPYWKALPFQNWTIAQQKELLSKYSKADVFLIDCSQKQENSTTFGGTGHSFDWFAPETVLVLQQLAKHKKIMIAGGLNPENIQIAHQHFKNIHENIIGFDLSTGAELMDKKTGDASRFLKDPTKIAQILKELKV